MEGVGARLGRSSTRYSIGPATVFTGPVRKWKKKWVQVHPSNPNHHHHHHQAVANKAVNGISSVSHLLFYKWTPITPNLNKDSNNNNNGIYNSDNDNAHSNASNREDAAAEEEPPRKKTKFIPIIVLEEQKNELSEQKNELSEQIEDDTKPLENDSSTVEASSKSDGHDETPDINDVQIGESQVPEKIPVEQSDLNGRTLDLSLGLKAHEGDDEPGPKGDRVKDGHNQNE